MTAFLITGTDTGVGKTVVTALLAAVGQGLGRNVCVYKPVQTGCPDPKAPEDPGLINRWLRTPVATACSYCFAEPVAPAAADPGGTIAVSHLVETARALQKQYDWLLVEGAGGVRVPVTRNDDMRDLMVRLNLPVILVARPNLGTINHTLLSVDALLARNIPVLGVVVSNMPEDTDDPAIRTLPHMLDTWLRVPVLAWIAPQTLAPGTLGPEEPAVQALSKALASAETVAAS